MYKDLYKHTLNNVELQEARRRMLLIVQKQKRAISQDKNRRMNEIASLTNPGISDSKRAHKHNKRSFKDIYNIDCSIQLSEWLRERPAELTEWILVPCPKGQRCMVVACNGRTEMFNKEGRFQWRFHSMLPGDGNGRNTITILDCLYVKQQDTFYVLDTLAFGNQNFMECEAEFRMFWIRNKLDEFELSEVRARNQKRFISLGTYDFENTSRVCEALQRYPLWQGNCPELDGFLFYHKEADYTCGTTPLVGWLFPFMVTEVLGFEVALEYESPPNYVGYQEYIEEFDIKLKKRLDRRSKSVEIPMEEESNEVEEDNSLQLDLSCSRWLELEGQEDVNGMDDFLEN